MKFDDAPAWLGKSCAVYGGWEPPMYLRRDRGEYDLETDFHEQHTDDAFRLIADAGITLYITHYHKGHGWQIIQDEIKDIRRQVQTLHRLGIQAGLYVRIDNIMGETFFLEMPAARN